MSSVAEKRASHVIEPREVNAEKTNNQLPVVLSMRAGFEQLANMADVSVPLRRPRKKSPSDDKALQLELDAWDAASDEAYRIVEELPEE